MTSPKPATEDTICVNTEHGAATTFCNDCAEFYCERCSSGHTLYSVTRGHRLKAVDVMSTAELKQATSACKDTCRQHVMERVTIYCKSCQIPVCPTCVIFKHKDHQHEELVEAARNARKELQKMIEATAQYVAQQDSITAEMETLQQAIQSDVKNAKTNIKQAAQRFRDVITQREEALLRELDVHEAEAVTKVKSALKEAAINKTSGVSFMQDTETLNQSGRDIDQVERTPGRLEEFEKFIEARQQKVRWELVCPDHKSSADTLNEMLGNVNLTSSTLAMMTSGYMKLEEPLQTVPLVYGGGNRVSGMAVLQDSLCITHEYASTLWLYDLKSGENKCWDIQKGANAQGIAVVNPADRTLVITDCNKKKLHFVKMLPNMEIVEHKVRDSPVSEPYKISVDTETGHLLLGRYYGREFAVCSTSGELQQLIKIPVDKGNGAECAVETKGGYAAIVFESGNDTSIHWLNQDGNIVCTYGNKEGEKGRKRHMCQTKYGELIVVDNTNQRLSLVDSKGHLLQHLLTAKDGIENPSCVHLDEESGRLYVAHGVRGSMEVRVYRWPSWPRDMNVTDFRMNVLLGKIP